MDSNLCISIFYRRNSTLGGLFFDLEDGKTINY